jgi:outer membrane protein assembly factor BamE
MIGRIMRPSTLNQNPRFPAAARALLFALLLPFFGAGCVYRIDIQQGNFLDPEKITQVQPGMTRSQVRYLLGTPLASTPFGDERWDYVYYFRRGHSSQYQERKVTVHFEQDKVSRVDRPAEDPEHAVQPARTAAT